MKTYYIFVIINSERLLSWCSASEQLDSFVGSHGQLLVNCDSPYPRPVKRLAAIPLDTNQAIVAFALAGVTAKVSKL